MYPDVVSIVYQYIILFHYPKRAMYGIFTYMYNKHQPSVKLGKHTNPIEYLGDDHQPLSPPMPAALYPTSTTALVLGHGNQDVAPTCCGTGRTIGNKLLMNPMGQGKRIMIRIFKEIKNKIKF